MDININININIKYENKDMGGDQQFVKFSYQLILTHQFYRLILNFGAETLLST